ncbi:hypothetical protein GCM10009710_26740 [Aeromicrobium alkaliterrae]|uniref:DUF305 domain-containing protein n=1 Tax=Aeromicrobium alkaliterrae TaxID=302168 RepID=A0ABP4W1Y4_9ACTN
MLVVLGLGLAACGEDETCAASDRVGCAPDPEPAGDPNDADEDYVLETALPVSEVQRLAELAAEESDDPEVVELAEEIADAADDFLAELRGREEQWDLEPLVYDSAVGAVTLPDYAGDEDYDVLQRLDGVEFDGYWVSVVLERTLTQLRDSGDLLYRGSDPGLRAVVEDWDAANDGWRDRLEVLQEEIR